MSLEVTTTTNDEFRATLAAAFNGPDSDSALLQAFAALKVAETAGMTAASNLKIALANEATRRGLDRVAAEADMRAALTAYLSAA